MKFGNLNKVLENEQNIYQVINENVKESSNNASMGNSGMGNLYGVKKPSRWSKLLVSLSHYGMNYRDQVYKNMVAVPADKLLQPKDDALLSQSLWGGGWNNWKIKPEEEKSFAEKTIEQRREILRRMAMQNELEDILDIMTNEAIVPDSDEAYICTPFLDNGLIQDLKEQSLEEINNALQTSFYKIYMLAQWKRNAWNQFKRWLIEGVLAYEIIYDDIEHPKSVQGIVDIDPATLTKVIKDGTTYWVQFKDQIGRERKLLDAQIIYIKYEDTGVSERQSYLERLIRPFNIYRIVEQAQVIWTVTQSSFKTMFTIPVGGMNKAKGAQTLAQAMNRYKEDISFNVETGELQVNGRVNLPFNKEYWMPENENGTPQIETLVDNGPMLNDSDQIDYFLKKLYKMSKIPGTRFDKDAQATWFGNDATQALRDEIDFTRFVNRLRNEFAEIILKPLRIQLSLSVPDMKNDKRILDAVSLRFNSYNLFEEMQNIEVMTKRIEFMGSIKDSITEMDSEGNETPYFSQKFLIMKYLKMSQADLELNEKYKLEEKLKANKDEEGDKDSEDQDTGDEDMPDMGSDESPDMDNEPDNGPEESPEDTGSESDEGGDIDAEMLGDVQPESPETAG